MKKTIRFFLVAGCAFGALALATNVKATEYKLPSCCTEATTAMAEVSTNTVPDLLPTCPVSGDKLGEMGKAFTFAYQGQEVKLCCRDCKTDFDKDPEKYVAKIRAADNQPVKH
jgi:YHS domain-containing protein